MDNKMVEIRWHGRGGQGAKGLWDVGLVKTGKGGSYGLAKGFAVILVLWTQIDEENPFCGQGWYFV